MPNFFGRHSELDCLGILNVLAPTHTPPPLSRPAGRKRGASCGRVFKGGKSELDCALTSKWLQRKHEAHRSISTREHGALKDLNGLGGLQQIKRLLHQFDGNVPTGAFFPPLKTRPNGAVSSLSAPAGVERVGVRGGIQRKKSKNAADRQPNSHGLAAIQNSEPVRPEPVEGSGSTSSPRTVFHVNETRILVRHTPTLVPNTKHRTIRGRGFEARNVQISSVSPSAGSRAPDRRNSP